MAAGPAIARPRLEPAFGGDQTALGRHVLYEAKRDQDSGQDGNYSLVDASVSAGVRLLA